LGPPYWSFKYYGLKSVHAECVDLISRVLRRLTYESVAFARSYTTSVDNCSYIYERTAKTKIGCDTLGKYFVMGSEATCPKCELKIDMTFSEIFTEKSLKELLDHYFFHRYKDKCVKLAKMRKSILFYLFCFNNFIIFRYQRYYNRNQFSIKIVNYCYTYKSFVIM